MYCTSIDVFNQTEHHYDIQRFSWGFVFVCFLIVLLLLLLLLFCVFVLLFFLLCFVVVVPSQYQIVIPLPTLHHFPPVYLPITGYS